MSKRIEPEDVFTPAAPVQEDMFASRRHEHLEDRVDSALGQRGRQVVLYGDTGVGKTSLVRHLCRQRAIKMVRVECGPPFDQMLGHALAQVRPAREKGRSSEQSSEAEGGFSLWGTLSGKARVGSGESVETAPIEPAPTSELAEALEERGIHVLFLDNFENLEGEKHGRATSRAIAQLLKSFADRAEDGGDRVKVVVAGIPSASRALIELDEATARRTAQIEVTRMPTEELMEILRRGEDKLGVEFGLAAWRIVRYSDGFPYYTHLLALHAVKRALRDGRREVSIADFDDALDEILADVDLALRTSYERAVETSGDVKLRKGIMEALASVEEPEVSFKTIREAFLRVRPQYETLDKLNFLSTAIRPLKERYGILEDRGLQKSKNNLYRFHNPLMRGYVRLRLRKENKTQTRFWDPEAGREDDDTQTTAGTGQGAPTNRP